MRSAEGECFLAIPASSGRRSAIRLQIIVEDSASVPAADVSTELVYEPKLPVRLREEVHAAIYQGVHGGIATLGRPIPGGGLVVRVMQLQLDHEGIGSVEFSQTRCAAAIQHLVTALVIVLLASVERDPPQTT